MYKPGASCCFGEMPLPAGVPSSQKGEQCHGRNLSRAFNQGRRCPIFLPIIHIPIAPLSPLNPLLLPVSQVLLQLCRQPANVERLVETQELQCLIIGLTSLWDQTSPAWRHQASRVLKAVSAVATSNTVPCLLGQIISFPPSDCQ